MSATMEPPLAAPPVTAPALLELTSVSRRFENGSLALSGVHLAIARGEFVSLLGASGCGKSTVLKLVAGLDQPTSGTITWATGKRPRISYVFQEPTLMPWTTALKNVLLPLSLARVPKFEAENRAREALAAVGLGDHANVYPRELSGGMKMRVSLARALVTQPEILLLDEPFAALDEITRSKLNNDLAHLWNERGFTAIFVTHSVFEAVYLSQRVIVMAKGPGRVYAVDTVSAPPIREETFRMSPLYGKQCAALSEKLKETMS